MSRFVGVVHLRDGDVPRLPPELLADAALTCRQYHGVGFALAHWQSQITLEDELERQPIPLGCGGALLFDGRLDDRSGLASALALPEHARWADGDLIAYAFQRWQNRCPPQLLGEFALAAWDGQGHLLLASDPSGLRPLFFHQAGDLFSFATALPMLLALPWVKPALDVHALVDVLANNLGDSANTCYRDIRRVVAGTMVSCRAGGVRSEEFWTPPLDTRLRLKDDGEYLEAAREVLDRAVRARLRSRHPVPLLGSGGLDSACLAMSLLRCNGGQTQAMVTMVPEPGKAARVSDSRYMSEREPVAALLAVAPGLAGTFIEACSVAELATTPESMFALTAHPIKAAVVNDWMAPALTHIASGGAQACITGSGGNFTLTWDGLRSLGSQLQRGQWLPMASQAMHLARGRPKAGAGFLWREAIRPLLASMVSLPQKWESRSLLQPALAGDPAVLARMRALRHDPAYIFATDGRDCRRQWIAHNRANIGNMAAWQRVRFGLETRMPLMDRRVIEFCLAIPEDQFLRHGQTRWLARRLLSADGVPASITQNTRRGAWCPEWFTRITRDLPALRQQARELRQSPLACRLLDLERVEQLLARWPEHEYAAPGLRQQLSGMLVHALHVGMFIRWAEALGAE